MNLSASSVVVDTVQIYDTLVRSLGGAIYLTLARYNTTIVLSVNVHKLAASNNRDLLVYALAADAEFFDEF